MALADIMSWHLFANQLQSINITRPLTHLKKFQPVRHLQRVLDGTSSSASKDERSDHC